jgi:diacylglycerol kinase family enzyme
LIANAQAGSVSARTKEVIIKALSADFKLEVVDTEARDHATDLARDAVDRGSTPFWCSEGTARSMRRLRQWL